MTSRTNIVPIPLFCASGQQVYCVNIDAIRVAPNRKPANVAAVQHDDLGFALAVGLVELSPLDLVAAPAEKPLDDPSLRLEVDRLDEGPIRSDGRP